MGHRKAHCPEMTKRVLHDRGSGSSIRARLAIFVAPPIERSGQDREFGLRSRLSERPLFKRASGTAPLGTVAGQFIRSWHPCPPPAKPVQATQSAAGPGLRERAQGTLSDWTKGQDRRNSDPHINNDIRASAQITLTGRGFRDRNSGSLCFISFLLAERAGKRAMHMKRKVQSANARSDCSGLI